MQINNSIRMDTMHKINYSKLTIFLHWFMLLLLIAVFATIELRGMFPKGSDGRNLIKMWHFMLGLSVLVFAVVRLANRLFSTTPPIVPKLPVWQEKLAKILHVILYIFILAMPIAGWLILSAAGKPVPFFGLELPPLIGQDKALAEQIEELHKTVGTAGYYLIGFHALAGIYHHFIAKDNTLKRMLP